MTAVLQPSGTVTLVFTDIEGSTKLLEELGTDGYKVALAEHRRIVREACSRYSGYEVDYEGDAFFYAFSSAQDAVFAVSEAMAGLEEGRISIRVGIHTGEPALDPPKYVGMDVHFAARVMSAAHGGQVICSKSTAELVELSLTDLGEHRLKDIEGAVSIYQLGDGSFPPLKTISNTNLPRPASSFVGRDTELEEVLSRIEQGARLVTLTGPGGTGKTRLALEAASGLVPSYKAGVFWVGLASLRDPALVTETIGQTLGAKDSLTAHVGERELLLLLDNIEQVVDCAPELSSLLESCPNLTLLVTSRELLRISGEVEYPVPPLAEPEAITLFCERAQTEPTEEIAELCARLDSLPLAVELAAARRKALTPAQILERLSSRLDLLKGGRDADPRQQTLRATIEWSYELLSPEEQELFARLSVFAGGCTLEAAEEVADASLDTLQSLVEKSLVRFTNERYWMLETIREYAAGRVWDTEREELESRHAAYFVAVADRSAAKLLGHEEMTTIAELTPDFPNVRQAVLSSLAAHKPDCVGAIVESLFPILITQGHLTEAGLWIDAALSDRSHLSDRGLFAVLLGGGEIARFAGDLDRAIELKERGVALLEHLPELSGWDPALFADLCDIALDQCDYSRARTYVERAVAAGGGPRVSASLAEHALRTGDFWSAQAHGDSSLEGCVEGEYNYACTLEILAETARRRGDVTSARDRFSEALRCFAVARDGGGIADCLYGLGRVAADTGDPERAARLHGAAMNVWTTSGRRPTRSDIPPIDAAEEAAARGAAMTFDEAFDYALSSID